MAESLPAADDASTQALAGPDAARQDAPSEEGPTQQATVPSPPPPGSASADGEEDEEPLPQSFDEFELSDEIRQALQALGWEKPTPIQCKAFGPITEGQDVLAQSHTGSGKTGGIFVCPGLPPVLSRATPGSPAFSCWSLFPRESWPSRCATSWCSWAVASPVVPLPVYGGTAMRPQLDALKAGVHAVVGTPGRVLDHIRRRTLKLDKVQMVVLDEADEMLSMGFLEDIHAILDACPQQRQTCLFSATVPPDIERIGRRYMSDALQIRLSGDQISAEAIAHLYYTVSGTMRTRDLLDIIAQEEPPASLIFLQHPRRDRLRGQRAAQRRVRRGAAVERSNPSGQGARDGGDAQRQAADARRHRRSQPRDRHLPT